MQNLDYGKRFRKTKPRQTYTIKTKESESLSTPHNPTLYDFFFNLEVHSLPIWYYLIIGILLFTSGVFVGMKLDQKESFFTNNELNTFRNLQTSDLNSEEPNSKTPRSQLQENSLLKEESVEANNFTNFPKNLQFPPKLNQINYIIQLGNFSREEATKLAASLIRERQEFQGRIFRTNTGKLYLGYYYDLAEAKAVLKKIKKFQDGVFQEASIKNMQF